MNTKSAYRPTDLLRFIDCLGGVLLPGDGGVVYVANTADGRTATNTSALWTDSEHVQRRLTASEYSQARPAVSPDGSKIAFLQQTGPASDDPWQLCVCPRAGGQATALTSFARGTGMAGPAWSSDGTEIAIDASDTPRRDLSKAHRITRRTWRRDGLGLIDDHQTDVWVIPAAGGHPRQITAEGGIVACLEWSPEGSKLLYVTFGAGDDTEYAIRIVDAASGDAQTIVTAALFVSPSIAAWTRGGKVVYTSPWTINKRIDLMIWDPATDAHETRTPDIQGQLFGHMVAGFDPRTIEPRVLVDDTGQYAYVYVQDRGCLRATRVGLAGPTHVEPLTDSSQSVAPMDIDGSRILAVRTSHTKPANLVILDTVVRSIHTVTELNSTWLTELPFEVHHLDYPTADGATEIEGWFLAPLYASRPYPTVLNIHGGPFMAHGEVFDVDNLLLTAAGYGVISVNYRSSSGYGDAHAAMVAGDWGRYDLADLLQAVDVAIERGLTDGDRVASIGRSAGGYHTSWLLTHSGRFRAGVSECPVTDWISLLGSDTPELAVGNTGRLPGGGPESMAPYIRTSPSTYAAHCSAPLLVLAHERDLRCPPSQSDILYNELKLAGKTTEMICLPGVPHSPFGANLTIRIQRAEAILEWINRWMRRASD